MDSVVPQAMQKSYSDVTIKKVCENKVTVRLYSELQNFRTLDAALGPYGAMCLLYETKARYGHWVAVFKIDSETYEFFDPYAIVPDGEFKFVGAGVADEEHQKPFVLSKLIESAAQTARVIYNQRQLQSYSENSDCCGRWCALRIRKKTMPLAAFQETFLGQSQSPDWLVTLATLVFDDPHD